MYTDEFNRDVVPVARRGDLTIPRVATDFGVAEETVCRWMRQADMDEGIKDGMTTAEQSELVGGVAAGEAPLADGQRDLAPRSRVFRFLNALKMTYAMVRDFWLPKVSRCG